eukprot:m.1103009 g.1103009  ORF g.1103009 m.1103009 type:complete len:2589 (+) comp24329_c0_seq1:101-7867(+)
MASAESRTSLLRQDLTNSVVKNRLVTGSPVLSTHTTVSQCTQRNMYNTELNTTTNHNLELAEQRKATAAEQLLTSSQGLAAVNVSGRNLRGATFTTNTCLSKALPNLKSLTSQSLTSHKDHTEGGRTCLSSSMLKSSHIAFSKRPVLLGGNPQVNTAAAKLQFTKDTLGDPMGLESIDVAIPRDCSEFRDVVEDVPIADDDTVKERRLGEQKTLLANAMASSLIGSPDYYSHGEDVTALMQSLAPVLEEDPEFVLKLALYTRCELNIRITANWLLAIVSAHPQGKLFLRKYFCKSIRLPSDWIEVAQLYQATCLNGDLKKGSLPAVLRKSMIDKFPEFDEYQLGKYNKNVSAKDKAKGKVCFTLKQLIRKLHIVNPVDHVLGILGKKYPSSHEEFVNMGLEGEFNADRAGKRMRLAVPETWETQVSLKGNTASTWEMLLNNRKLPFMAMLRNLRNIIQAGVSQRHHRMVINTLTNRHSVLNSRQFPFRFFSAYEALEAAFNVEGSQSKASAKSVRQMNVLKGTYHNALETAVTIATRGNVKPIPGASVLFCNVSDSMRQPCTTARGLGQSRNLLEAGLLLGLMCKYACESCDFHLFSDVNVPELSVKLQHGNILANLDYLLAKCGNHTMDWGQMSMSTNASEDKEGAGFPFGVLDDILKERRSIDKILVFSNDGTPAPRLTAFVARYRRMVNPKLLFVCVDLSSRTSGVQQSSEKQSTNDNDVFVSGFSDAILRYISDRGDGPGQVATIEGIDRAYGVKSKADAVKEGADHNRRARMARRGRDHPRNNNSSSKGSSGADSRDRRAGVAKDASRVTSTKSTVSTTDDASSIWNSFPSTSAATLSSTEHLSRVIKVFISSTFRDMHGERDVLTKFVFPELRSRCQAYGLDVHEIDLRWGVTEEMTQNHATLPLCLDEIDTSTFFVGMLGERYGWVPDNGFHIPNEARFDWVRAYPEGRSITELEMYHAALRTPATAAGRVLFALRDPKFVTEHVADDAQQDFSSESPAAAARLKDLKTTVQALATEGVPILSDYTATFDGSITDKFAASGLDTFASWFLDHLWDMIRERYGLASPNGIALQTDSKAADLHDEFCAREAASFVGRIGLVERLTNWVHKPAGRERIAVLHGPHGTGKSAFLAHVSSRLTHAHRAVVHHFVGAVPGSSSLLCMLRHLCDSLAQLVRSASRTPRDGAGLKSYFHNLLEMAGRRLEHGVVMVIDGIDCVQTSALGEHKSSNGIEWIPSTVPQGVVFVVSATDLKTIRMLKTRKDVTDIKLPSLKVRDGAQLVRQTLSVYRKTLDESAFNNQLQLLLSKPDAKLPLYLKIVCEELRVFAVYEQLTHHITTIPGKLEELLHMVLHRFEMDHGVVLVTACFRLLGCSRAGLTSTAMAGLLRHCSGQRNVSPMGASRLWRSLLPFLSVHDEVQGLCAIGSSALADVVTQRYMADADAVVAVHVSLAKYYRHVADPSHDHTYRGRNTEAFRALPYHLVHGECWSELKQVLCSLAYIQAKCALGLVAELVADYQPQASVPRSSNATLRRVLLQQCVREFDTFVRNHANVIANAPVLVTQQALNEPDHSAPHQTAMTWIHNRAASATSGRSGIHTYAWVNKANSRPACELTIATSAVDVTCLSAHPDGSVFAAGNAEGTVHLYETATGRSVGSLAGHVGAVAGVCFVGARVLCSIGRDLLVAFWRVSDASLIKSYGKHFTRRISDVAANASGELVVCCGWDGKARCYRGKNGQLEATLEVESSSPINTIAWHSDARMTALGHWDGTISLWDTFTQTVTTTLAAHTQSVLSIAFHPNGQLVSTGLDSTMKLWAAESYALLGSGSVGSVPVEGLNFSTVSGGEPCVLARAGGDIQTWQGKLGSRTHGSRDVTSFGAAAVVLPGRKKKDITVIGFYTGLVVVTHPVTNKCMARLENHPRECVAALEQQYNRVIVVATQVGTGVYVYHRTAVGRGSSAYVWNMSHTLSASDLPVTSLAFHPDDGSLLASSDDSTIAVWSHEHVMNTHATDSEHGRTPLEILTNHDNAVTSVAFVNSHAFVSVSKDCMLMKWSRLQRGLSYVAVQQVKNCHLDWVNAVCVSPSGTFVATASNDCTVTVRLASNLSLLHTFTGHQGAVLSISFVTTTDGTEDLLASCGMDECVRFWSQSLDSELTSVLNRTPVTAVADSGNDGVLVACTHGVVECDVSFGTKLGTLDGHSGPVAAVTCTRRRQLISCGRDDKTIRVWSVDASKHIAPGTTTQFKTPERHAGCITAVAGDPDGCVVVAGDTTGAVVQWHIVHAGKNVSGVFSRVGLGAASHTACNLQLVRGGQNAARHRHSGVTSGVVVRVSPTEFCREDTTVGCSAIAWSCGEDGMVKKWTLCSRVAEASHAPQDLGLQHQLDLKTPLASIAATSDGSLVACGDWMGHVHIAKADLSTILTTIFLSEDWITSLAFTDSGILASCTNGKTFVYNIESHACDSLTEASEGNVGCVVGVLDRQDGDTAETVGICSDGAVLLWRDRTTAPETIARVSIDPVTTIAQRGTTGNLFVGLESGQIKEFSVGPRHAVQQCGQFACRATCTAMAVTDKLVVAGDKLGYVYVLQQLDS